MQQQVKTEQVYLSEDQNLQLPQTQVKNSSDGAMKHQYSHLETSYTIYRKKNTYDLIIISGGRRNSSIEINKNLEYSMPEKYLSNLIFQTSLNLPAERHKQLMQKVVNRASKETN